MTSLHPTPAGGVRPVRSLCLFARIVLVVMVALGAGAVQARVYEVTTTGDGPVSPCVPSGSRDLCTTLRDAVAAANATAASDSVLAPSGTITLTHGELGIANNGSLYIYGGAATTISGNHTSRVLRIDANAVARLYDLTIINGRVDFLDDAGGGIHNSGTLTVTRSTVRDNWARNEGGGIYNKLGSTLTLDRSTVSNNYSDWQGGGINNLGAATLRNSTISGNDALCCGGGLLNFGTMTLEFSTISGNATGVENRGTATATINYSVIANSTGGAGDCPTNAQSGSSGTINAGWSVIESGTACVNGLSFAVWDGDPKLGPLADNGGPTPTHLPLPGSMLINAIPGAGSIIATDQRGVARPQGIGHDIGAVEVMVPLFENGFESP